MAGRTNPEFLNGVPELVILHRLAVRPMHGYQLVQDIRETSGHVFEFGEGCIYPLLHRMEAEGLLASERKEVQSRSRVVYRLTAAGRKRLTGSAASWRRVAEAVGKIIDGGFHEPRTA